MATYTYEHRVTFRIELDTLREPTIKLLAKEFEEDFLEGGETGVFEADVRFTYSDPIPATRVDPACGGVVEDILAVKIGGTDLRADLPQAALDDIKEALEGSAGKWYGRDDE